MNDPIKPIQFLDFEDMCNTQADLCKVLQAALRSAIPNDGGYYVLALMEQIAANSYDAAHHEFTKEIPHQRAA